MSFTRARSKLVIFGSRKTLQAVPILAEFFNLMEAQGWIYSLPPGADKMHIASSPSIASIPQKRTVQDAEELSSGVGKENLVPDKGQAPKKAKQIKRSTSENGLLRGRPILKNLLQNGD